MLFKNENYDFSKWGIDEKTLYIQIRKDNSKPLQERIDEGYYNCWNEERIKKAFKNGNGTIRDFLEYAKNNSNLIDFVEI